MFVIEVARDSADKNEKQIELAVHGYVEKGVVLILILRAYLVSVNSVYISSGEYHEIDVVMLCRDHNSLAYGVVEFVLKVTYEKRDLVSFVFVLFHMIYHPLPRRVLFIKADLFDNAHKFV